MKLIYIKWADAFYNEETCSMDNINAEAPFILETSGFYVNKTDEYICLCSEITPEGQYKYRHYIPLVNIIEKRIIEVKGKRK